MAKKAIYGKYQCISTPYTAYVMFMYQSNWGGIAIPNHKTVSSSYRFDENTGTFYSAGTTSAGLSFDPAYYLFDSKHLYEYSGIGSNGATATGNKNMYRVDEETRYNYSKGTHITDVIADLNSLPADGRHSNEYWYVFVKMASDLKANVSGTWRDIPTGWINDSGIWKPQSELKCNVSGIFK